MRRSIFSLGAQARRSCQSSAFSACQGSNFAKTGMATSTPLIRSLHSHSMLRRSILPSPNHSHTSHRAFHLSPPRSTTLNQVIRGARKGKKWYAPRLPALEGGPMRKAVCVRVYKMKPRKPNSAERRVAKVKTSTGRSVIAYIPGEGHNLMEHSVVYIRGGRTKDLPGLKYKMVRGKGDLHGVVGRMSSRSKYGVKKPKQ